MANELNLKLKDKVEPSVLLKYGFIPKYDEDTGKVKEYRKKIHIDSKYPNEKHFTFVLNTRCTTKGIFRRKICYEAWMTGWSWSSICEIEAMQLLYDLIIDGVVELAEDRSVKDVK